MTDFFDTHALDRAVGEGEEGNRWTRDGLGEDESKEELDDLCEPFLANKDELEDSEPIVAIGWKETTGGNNDGEPKQFRLFLTGSEETTSNIKLQFYFQIPAAAEEGSLEGAWGIKTVTFAESGEKLELKYDEDNGSRRPVNIGEIDPESITDENTGPGFLTLDTSFRTKGLPDYDELANMYFSNEPPESVERIKKIDYWAPSGGATNYANETPLKTTLHSKLHDFEPTHRSGSQTWDYEFPDIEYRADEQEQRFFASGDDGRFVDENDDPLSIEELVFRLLLLHIAIRIVLDLYKGTEELFDVDGEYEFLTPSHFQLPRPVDLNPRTVRKELRDDGYFFPSHVIDAVCTSLNAGKHVILTGPPGCGKSKIAMEISKIFLEKEEQEVQTPLVATASPAWSTNEVIGRYLPRQDGTGLEFDPGFFLRSIEAQRWLVIDEFNRADVDAAFGELFSVLAGDVAEIPYREYPDEGTAEVEEVEDDEVQGQRVRIVPFGADAEGDEYRDYHVPQNFRLLATMNDADRSRLHQLSYALQRRFNIVRIEAPSAEVLRKKIIKPTIWDRAETYGLFGRRSTTECFEERHDIDGPGTPEHGFKVKVQDSAHHDLALNNQGVVDVLKELFAPPQMSSEGESGSRAFEGFVAERVVGVSAVIDTIEFLAEALRPSDESGDDESEASSFGLYCEESDVGSQNDVAKELAISFIALGISMNVVPQLEQLTTRPEKLNDAIRFLFETFWDDQEDERIRFWRIESMGRLEDDYSDDLDDDVDYDLLKQDEYINDFLAEEIALQLGRAGVSDIQWDQFVDGDDGLLSRAPDVY